MCAHTHTRVYMHWYKYTPLAEVRGQLVSIGAILLPCGLLGSVSSGQQPEPSPRPKHLLFPSVENTIPGWPECRAPTPEHSHPSPSDKAQVGTGLPPLNP